MKENAKKNHEPSSNNGTTEHPPAMTPPAMDLSDPKDSPCGFTFEQLRQTALEFYRMYPRGEGHAYSNDPIESPLVVHAAVWEAYSVLSTWKKYYDGQQKHLRKMQTPAADAMLEGQSVPFRDAAKRIFGTKSRKSETDLQEFLSVLIRAFDNRPGLQDIKSAAQKCQEEQCIPEGFFGILTGAYLSYRKELRSKKSKENAQKRWDKQPKKAAPNNNEVLNTPKERRKVGREVSKAVGIMMSKPS
jgi:hypothetical protein